MKLAELLAAVNSRGGATITPRMHRFLTTEGIVSPPIGKTRYAEYTEAHVSEILRYLRLSSAGYPLAAIKMLSSAHEVAPGILLVVYSSEIDRTLDVTTVSERVSAIINDLLREDKDAEANAEP